MQYADIRRIVVEAVTEAVEKGLVNGTSGNISMRDPKEPNLVAITPSGISYRGMRPEDIAIVEMKADGTNAWMDGPYKPSSELPMHTALYRARPEMQACVHTHSMYATICAMGEHPELLPITPPQCEYSPVGVVGFFLPGSQEIAQEVVRTLGDQGKVCLMKNHGMFSCGKDMTDAMYATIYTEEMAQTTVFAKMLGNYEPMPKEAVDAMQAMIKSHQAV